jgi:hypothetical protein
MSQKNRTNLLQKPTAASANLLNRLITTPDLVNSVRGLPIPVFNTLIRDIGVEDAGEIIALATTEQLVAAFDEDLFANAQPGEREEFDSARFLIWLEILLEAGEDVAARRVAELSEDFVTLALSSAICVLKHDTLVERMRTWGEDALYAEKIIEGSHLEELDGYLLISRIHDGWDAVFSLILALDRDHRGFLVRVLDRCADITDDYTHDPEDLITMLSCEESLADDVEAEREERRSALGYVEPRAARSFLSLAKQPFTTDVASDGRDPVTRAYFRDRTTAPEILPREFEHRQRIAALLDENHPDAPSRSIPAPANEFDNPGDAGHPSIITAMRLLNEFEPVSFSKRVEEMQYLANVFIAGAGTVARRRFRPADAAEATLATVGLGAELVVREQAACSTTDLSVTPMELCRILGSCHADILFRKASSTLTEHHITTASLGFVSNYGELDVVRVLLEEHLCRRCRVTPERMKDS